MRSPVDLPRRLPGTSRRLRIVVLVVTVAIILLLLSLRSVARFWTDYLWFQEVGFTSVFRGVLVTKVFLAVAFSAVFFLMMLLSLTVADRVSPDPAVVTEDELVERYREVAGPHRRSVRIVTALVFGLFGGIGANAQWNHWDLFRYQVSFGIKDPQFHRDIGFYVFQLPFIKFLLTWSFQAVTVTLIVTVVLHYLNGGIRFQGAGRRVSSAVKTHVSVLLGVLALIQAVSYYYQRLELVLSTQYLVNGATATVVHATLPAKTLLIAIAVIAAVLFLYNIRQKGWTLPIVAVGLWGLVYVLVGAVYPAVYQALRVAPSELTKEAPYIQRNIKATLDAYGLNAVKTHPYQGNATVQASQIVGSSPAEVANQQTLANVRLLDPTAVNLLVTFDRYQALRTYYQFNTLSIDRYPLPASVNGGTGSNQQMTATISSVRELNNQIPTGFVNAHLAYTHGYGAVLAPVSQAGVNPDGTPNFSLSDLPPVGVPSLSEQGSQVYYGIGSQTNGYVIADTKTAEVDYENNAGQQITTRYAGNGGVLAGGFIRRLAFALRFGDPNIVLTGQINNNSRVMYIRNISARVQKAAPFLKLDADPYSVLLNNQIYWVQDAYTTSNYYPYSQTANTDRVINSGLDSTFNYVRNSVKVVINAYNGSMYFFVTDPSDPIIRVYERAFPDLFTPVSQANKLIPGIVNHFRYPEDLFKVQANMYGRYHLTSANAFYTQAQAWSVSQDPGSGPLSSSTVGAQLLTNAGLQPAPVQRLQPEYLLAHLPHQTQQSFMILTPFVPVSPSNKQQNLTAFMVASSDPADYGTIRVYTTPPAGTVAGPAQITNAIKSNSQISQELTLLNQQSSTVELGQLVVVPIDQTLLYVQPIYVESTSNAIPTLKDVVVVYNNIAYHSGNVSLDAALCQITNPDGSKPFGSYCGTTEANNPSTVTNIGGGSTPGGVTTPTTATTAPSSTSPTTVAPPPASGATVASLLAQANATLAQANAALKAQNLGQYQTLVNQAESDLAQAQQLESGGSGAAGSATSTTTPPTTSAPPASTTTVAPGG
ncbi:MAG: UPF0182 family membrane protein [Acidimicrobiales bacterium]